VASIREEIEHDLSRNGSRLVELKRLWFYAPALFSAELSQPNVVYRAIGQSIRGETISRVYAWDCLGWGSSGRAGLKRRVQTGWVEV
jgi:hypothetical protein